VTPTEPFHDGRSEFDGEGWKFSGFGGSYPSRVVSISAKLFCAAAKAGVLRFA